MRVRLDEQLPRRLGREITGHEVRTVQQQGWAGLSNGELLRRAVTGGFNVFVTADRNLEHQQDTTGHAIGVVVLVAPSIAIADLRALVPGLLTAIAAIEPGEVLRLDA